MAILSFSGSNELLKGDVISNVIEKNKACIASVLITK